MITNTTSQSLAPVANDIRDIKPPIEIPNGWEWLWITPRYAGGRGGFVHALAMVGEATGADCIRATRAGAHPREAKTGRKRLC